MNYVVSMICLVKKEMQQEELHKLNTVHTDGIPVLALMNKYSNIFGEVENKDGMYK